VIRVENDAEMLAVLRGRPFETDCSANLATLRLVEDAYRQAAL
jgi:hypothetical protein